MSVEGRLAEIWIYPIKSCGGVRLDRIVCTPTGPRWDRRYLLIDAHGQFVSQRTHPLLARVALRLDLRRAELEASAKDRPPLRLPLDPPASPDLLRIEIFGEQFEAPLGPEYAALWFSELLGEPIRLLACNGDFGTQKVKGTTKRTSFTDGYPWLAISQASLDELNTRLAASEAPTVAMRRFRPNLIFADVAAHAEDRLGHLSVGEVDFEARKPCARCLITTVAPELGAFAGPEPLRTLATYRRAEGGVMFGQNLIHHGAGTLQVGDAIRWPA